MADYKEKAQLVLSVNDREFKQSMRKLQRDARKQGEVIRKSLLAGMGIGIAGGLATKIAAEFEQGLAGVKKTTGLTGKALQDLGRDIRELSRDTGLGAEALLGITQAAGQLGVKGRANLVKYTETISMLGTASDLAGEEAAFALSRFINVTQAGEENVDRLAASLVALGNQFATTEAEAIHTANAIAAKASVYGLSAQAALGYGVALNAMGQGGEAAGMAFSKLFLNLKTASDEGGEALVKWADIAQISIEEMQRLVAEDADAAIQKVLEGLNRYGKDAVSVLRDAGVVEERAIARLVSLAGNLDLTKDALDTAAKGWEENTALTEEFNTMMDTLEKQSAKLVEKLRDIARTLGMELAPTARGFVDTLNELLTSENIATAAKLLVQLLKWGTAFILARAGIAAFLVAWAGLKAAKTLVMGFTAAVGVMGAMTNAAIAAAILLRVKMAAATLGLTWVLAELAPKLIAWAFKTEGKLDYLAAKFDILWSNVRIAGTKLMKFLHIGFMALPTAIGEAVRLIWNALVPKFLEIERSALSWLSAVADGYNDKIKGLQDEQLVFYQKANDAAQRYKNSVLELNKEIARNPFDKVGIADDHGPAKPPTAEEAQAAASAARTRSRARALHAVYAKQMADSVQASADAEAAKRAELAKTHADQMKFAAATRQQAADDARRANAAPMRGQFAQAGSGGGAGTDRSALTSMEAAAALRQEQIEFEYETEEELLRMHLARADEIEMEFYQRRRELEAERAQIERMDDESKKKAALTRNERHFKDLEDREKRHTLSQINEWGARSRKAGKIIQAAAKAQAIYYLTAEAPKQAAKAYGRAMETFPPPFNFGIAAAVAGAVMAKAVAGVQNAKSMTMTGLAKGGLIPGGYGVRDDQLYAMHKGEVAVPRQNYAELKRMHQQEALDGLADDAEGGGGSRLGDNEQRVQVQFDGEAGRILRELDDQTAALRTG